VCCSFAKFKAIELLTSSEMDAAPDKSMTYRAPGRCIKPRPVQRASL
jgi:hypothetical protein